MATRPIFIVETTGPTLVRVQSVEFVWVAGMARSQRQKSMRSLHEAARMLHSNARILEVSRMSDNPIGERLSAFNLTLDNPDINRAIPVECAFQSSKMFERGGPFLDLLTASPVDAKRDPRLQNSGQLIGFRYLGEDWPKSPPTAFYDWIYLSALHRHPNLAFEITRFDIFTDIAFNPAKSMNCQASAVALYVALVRRNILPTTLSSREAFLAVEQNASEKDDTLKRQGSLF